MHMQKMQCMYLIFLISFFCFCGQIAIFLAQNLSNTNPMILKLSRQKLDSLRIIFHLDNFSWFITDFAQFSIQNRLLILYDGNSEPTSNNHISLTINLLLMHFMSRVRSLSYLQLSFRPFSQILQKFT